MKLGEHPVLARSYQLFETEEFGRAEDLLRAVLEAGRTDPLLTYALGYAILKQNRPDEALTWLYRGRDLGRKGLAAALQEFKTQQRKEVDGTDLSNQPLDLEYYFFVLNLIERAIGWILHENGRGRQAEQHFGQAIMMQARYDRLMGQDQRTDPVILVSDLSKYIGESATQLDLYLKLTKLGWIPARRPQIACDSKTANRYFLDLWRDRIDLLDKSPSEIKGSNGFDMQIPLLHEGRGLCCSVAASLVEREWQMRGYEPQLQLPAQDCTEGWRFLRQATGMGPEDWFVTLHMRDDGYGKATGRNESRFQTSQSNAGANIGSCESDYRSRWLGYSPWGGGCACSAAYAGFI